MSPTLAMADANDLDDVARLLAETALPTDDLRTAPARFYLGRVGGESVAVGGIEDCGPVGLLRSVAVLPNHRGKGLGAAMVAALVDIAAADYEALYLLTTDAAGFFDAHGFDPVAREKLPESVRETRQFSELCPDDAVAMHRRL